MIKAVIFDQDGVILDTEKINLSSAVQALAQLGINLAEEDKKLIIGIHPVDYKNAMLAKYNFDFDRYVKIKREIYYQELEMVPFFTKTVEIIKKLAAQKILLGLVTSSKRETTNKIFKRGGLENIFKATVCFEDCELRKPAPDCYSLAASKLNFPVNECLVIEDSNPGLTAAKSAGMTCFVIPNQTTKDQDFSQADKIIDYETELKYQLFADILEKS